MKKYRKILIIGLVALLILAVAAILGLQNVDEDNENAFLEPDYTPYASKVVNDIKSVNKDQVKFSLTISDDKLKTLSAEGVSWTTCNLNGHFAMADVNAIEERFANYPVYLRTKNSDQIFLSFDLTYEQGFTNHILDVLGENNINAAFFINLEYVRQRPDLVQRMIDEGHIIGFLTDEYFPPTDAQLDNSFKIAADILTFHGFMNENFNYKVSLVRIAGVTVSEKLIAIIENLGYKTILYSQRFTDSRYEKEYILDELLATNFAGDIKDLETDTGSLATALEDYVSESTKEYTFGDWNGFVE